MVHKLNKGEPYVASIGGITCMVVSSVSTHKEHGGSHTILKVLVKPIKGYTEIKGLLG